MAPILHKGRIWPKCVRLRFVRRKYLSRVMYAVLLLAWIRFIWNVPSGPSDLPGTRWVPLIVLAAQVIRPTMVGWVLVAFSSVLYGLLLLIGLLRGDWFMLEGLAWWLLIVACLCVDMATRFRSNAANGSAARKM